METCHYTPADRLLAGGRIEEDWLARTCDDQLRREVERPCLSMIREDSELRDEVSRLFEDLFDGKSSTEVIEECNVSRKKTDEHCELEFLLSRLFTMYEMCRHLKSKRTMEHIRSMLLKHTDLLDPEARPPLVVDTAEASKDPMLVETVVGASPLMSSRQGSQDQPPCKRFRPDVQSSKVSGSLVSSDEKTAHADESDNNQKTMDDLINDLMTLVHKISIDYQLNETQADVTSNAIEEIVFRLKGEMAEMLAMEWIEALHSVVKEVVSKSWVLHGSKAKGMQILVPNKTNYIWKTNSVMDELVTHPKHIEGLQFGGSQGTHSKDSVINRQIMIFVHMTTATHADLASKRMLAK